MDDIKELSLEDLAALATEKREARAALFEVETPTDEQVEQAETLTSEIEQIETETAEREVAAAAKAEKWSSLKEAASAPKEETEDERKKREADEKKKDPPVKAAEESPEDPAPEDDDDEDADGDSDDAEGADVSEPESISAGGNVKRLGRKSKRPAPPAIAEKSPVSIIAAANTDFSAGTKINMADVGVALQSKVAGMPKPDVSLRGRDDVPMQKYPVAKFQVEYPDELVITEHTDDMAVLAEAGRESRLPGESLVAAGGWCAPSETIYDFCEGETLDGLISLPEVNVKRGGINYTKGPQFSDFYGVPWTDGAGFLQTETEAIAGTTKDCFTIDCPEFTEVRLDAVGLCIKVPILTEAAYPELIRRVTSGAMTAQQHRISVEIIDRIVTLTGAARVIAGLGSTVSDSLEGLELLADQRREQFRLSLSASLEVILPFWVKGMYRSDLARRQGVAAEAISDAQIMAHFAARNLAVQFVYGWQPMSGFASPPAEVYPATYQALLYPAGTFVVGKADVINLSAVYDAASLEVNVYTGVFTEQGILVAEMCYDSDLVTLPVCNAGRTGASDLTCEVAP